MSAASIAFFAAILPAMAQQPGTLPLRDLSRKEASSQGAPQSESSTKTGSASGSSTSAVDGTSDSTSGMPSRRPQNSGAGAQGDRNQQLDESELSPRPGSLVRFRGEDGKPVWVPFGVTMEQFFKWLRTQNSAGEKEPEYSISSISLEGTANDERAALTATVKILVGQSGRAVRVPISLQEGYLVPPVIRHTGPGDFRAVPTLDPADGHVVYLSGKGLHELVLSLLVPIRRQLNQRHLQLTIPPAAGSQLILHVSQKQCDVKPIERAMVNPVSVSDGTRIEVVGMKGPFDLAWDVPPTLPQTRTVFDVFNKFALGMEEDRVQVRVLQTIESKQGNVASIRVRIPTGTRTLAGQQLNVSEAKIYKAQDIDSAGFIKVDLKPVGTGRVVELRWEFQIKVPINTTFALRGFEVEGARSELGEVLVAPTEGFRFDYRGGSNVQRINVPTLGVGLAESAFSFSQPFRLDFILEEIRPQFSVEPTFFLLLSEQRAELTGQFRIQVRQGAVREIVFQWPQWKKQLWTIEQTPENTEIVENDPRDKTSENTLRFRLNGRQDKNEFLLTFRAVRPCPGKGITFPLTLPELVGSLRQASTLVVADSENVKSRLEPRAETTVQPILAERKEVIDVPDSFRGLKQNVLRVESVVGAFDASVSVQQQSIETESTVRIEIQAGRLRVAQRISYQVAYERLAEASLVLPKGLDKADVQFYVDRSDVDFEAVPSWFTGDVDSGEVARIAFPEPRIGSFDIFARYLVSLPDASSIEGSVDIPVPLLRSRDAAFKVIRVELQAQDDMEAEVVDDTWSPQIADKTSTHAWTATGDQMVIPLRLLRTITGTAPDLKIARALIRSIVDMSGAAQTIALYRLEHPASTVVLTLPLGSIDPKFWLDDVELNSERVHELRPSTSEFRLTISSLSPNAKQILRVEYRIPDGTPCGLVGFHRLEAPAFPDGTSVGPLLWEVTLPYDEFLLSDPSGFSPEFRWKRDSVFWTRKPTGQAADLAAWLGGDVSPVRVEGNAYAFSRFGSARSIVVGSVGQSAVLFVGAGLSLLAAFVLMRVPLARTPLTLFVFGFAVAFAYLWSPEAVRLLLQPAILGFLLAASAAALDLRMQRHRSRFSLAAPSAADFVATAASPSSLERALVQVSPAEAPTISRPGSGSGSPPISASEVGSSP